jgi:hypothetical protein
MVRKNAIRYLLMLPVMAGCWAMTGAGVPAKDALIKANFSVDKAVHDFGTVSVSAGKVSAVFTITNTSAAPIVISKVTASCGCTTPTWTKSPIEPGKTGAVTAVYNQSAKGPFEKSVTIVVSAGDSAEQAVVKIKGTTTD